MRGNVMSVLDDNVTTLSDGTAYVPVIRAGMVGYRCQHRDGRETFVYFNPSDHTDNDVPNVFVYEGPHFDPARDTPANHYVIDWRTS